MWIQLPRTICDRPTTSGTVQMSYTSTGVLLSKLCFTHPPLATLRRSAAPAQRAGAAERRTLISRFVSENLAFLCDFHFRIFRFSGFWCLFAGFHHAGWRLSPACTSSRSAGEVQPSHQRRLDYERTLAVTICVANYLACEFAARRDDCRPA